MVSLRNTCNVAITIFVVLSLTSLSIAGRRDRKRDKGRGRGRDRGRGVNGGGVSGGDALNRETGGKFKYINGQWCAACELRKCAQIAPANCPGEVRRDDCGCCPVCVPRAPELPPVPTDSAGPTNTVSRSSNTTDIPSIETTRENPCDKVACGKRQVCVLNIQGIPMCRCPSTYWCRSMEKNPLCGKDGVTYRSRCYLRMAECEADRNIILAHKGRCRKEDRSNDQPPIVYPPGRSTEKKSGRRRKKQMMRLKRKQQELLKVEKRAEKMRQRNEKLEQKLFPESKTGTAHETGVSTGDSRHDRGDSGSRSASAGVIATMSGITTVGGAGGGVISTHPLGKDRRRDSRTRGKGAKFERKKSKKMKKLRRRKRRQGQNRKINKLWSL